MLKNTFCSSPWFHIRIDPQGTLLPCRWAHRDTPSTHNIADTTLLEYVNSKTMRTIRSELLDGKQLEMCSPCLYDDKHNKVSGRQRQLLKSAIFINKFEQSFTASPHYEWFKKSYEQEGHTDRLPIDLQIDLGNTCNGACIMCSPTYSSKLKADYDKLTELEPTVFRIFDQVKNWADDPVLLDKFVEELISIPNIKYIHFLGGETLYLNSFYTICNRLIEAGVAKDISIGTTTNCTVYSKELENIIRNFKHVHLGLSIESLHKVNDYIRWPGKIDVISSNIQKFLTLRNETDLHLSLRITPNIFSIYHIDTLFELMIKEQVIAESCQLLYDPTCLRVELLPKQLVAECIDKINQLIQTYRLEPTGQVIINQRDDNLINPVISQVIFEYKQFLESYTVPHNVEEERYKLVKFLRAFETIRKNNILEYMPEYEEFLRSYGY